MTDSEAEAQGDEATVQSPYRGGRTGREREGGPQSRTTEHPLARIGVVPRTASKPTGSGEGVRWPQQGGGPNVGDACSRTVLGLTRETAGLKCDGCLV